MACYPALFFWSWDKQSYIRAASLITAPSCLFRDSSSPAWLVEEWHYLWPDRLHYKKTKKNRKNCNWRVVVVVAAGPAATANPVCSGAGSSLPPTKVHHEASGGGSVHCRWLRVGVYAECIHYSYISQSRKAANLAGCSLVLLMKAKAFNLLID